MSSTQSISSPSAQRAPARSVPGSSRVGGTTSASSSVVHARGPRGEEGGGWHAQDVVAKLGETYGLLGGKTVGGAQSDEQFLGDEGLARGSTW
ncbi:MAG: hypothetical protein M0035_04960 [Actinomycetota bacterium]|nr:hypothetical protein [Actinomycetota bacterium]MDA8355503.1 hypothetical protein [Actinomycetota bacterium]